MIRTLKCGNVTFSFSLFLGVSFHVHVTYLRVLKCVSIHVVTFQSPYHDTVPFKNKKIHLVLPGYKFHQDQKYEVHCKDCSIYIKCCIGNATLLMFSLTSTMLLRVVKKKQELKKKIEKKLKENSNYVFVSESKHCR